MKYKNIYPINTFKGEVQKELVTLLEGVEALAHKRCVDMIEKMKLLENDSWDFNTGSYNQALDDLLTNLNDKKVSNSGCSCQGLGGCKFSLYGKKCGISNR